MRDRTIAARVLYCGACLLLSLAAVTAGAATAGPPRDVVLVLDNSGSMRKHDSGFAIKAAVGGFIHRLTDGDRVAVIIFAHRVDLAEPLTLLDKTSRPRVLASLKRIDYRGKYTDSPTAIERAVYELKSNGRGDARKSIVFLTDGIVDTGDPVRDRAASGWLREEVADAAVHGGVKVYGIAFTKNADLELIQTLADRTGGDYVRAAKAGDLAPAMNRIADEILAPPPPAPEPTAASPPAPSAEPAAEPGPAPQPVPEQAGAPLPAESAPAAPAEEAAGTANPSKPPTPAPTGEPASSPPSVAQGGTQPAARSAQAVPHAPAAPAAAAGGTLAGLSRLDVLTVAVAGLAGAILLLVLYLLFGGRSRQQREVAAQSPAGPAERAFLDDLDRVTGKLRHELLGERVTVGRGLHGDQPGGQHIQIPRDTVSRLHGSIERRKDGYWLVDSGSVNGVYLNGLRVQGQRRLTSGDRLRFHQFNFAFRIGGSSDDDERTVFAPLAGEQAKQGGPSPAATETPETTGERFDATVILSRGSGNASKEPAPAPEANAAEGLEKTMLLTPEALQQLRSAASAQPAQGEEPPQAKDAGADDVPAEFVRTAILPPGEAGATAEGPEQGSDTAAESGGAPRPGDADAADAREKPDPEAEGDMGKTVILRPPGTEGSKD